MSYPRTPKKRFDHERAIAESPYPIMPVKPKGVRRKDELNINYHELREEMARKNANRPPRTPPRPAFAELPRPTTPASLRKKRDPTDILFIKKKPVINGTPFKESTERMRHVSSPYPLSSPMSPRGTRRAVSGSSVISGPAPDLFYATVPQHVLYPTDEDARNPPLYPPDDDVILGSNPKLGCGVSVADAVSCEPLNIRTKAIVVGFMWKGYEPLGIFQEAIYIPDFQTRPFEMRREILKKVDAMFQNFKKKVKTYRDARLMQACHPDVLVFGDSDIRITRLERRVDNYYQAVFTYPARKNR